MKAPELPIADHSADSIYTEASLNDYGDRMYDYGHSKSLLDAIKDDERRVMRVLADRIAGNAHPEEDGRLEVAYAIARYLGLDWTAAARPVVVSPDANADEMNHLHGHAYGVDWVYPAVSAP